jgi:hypothetical protein
MAMTSEPTPSESASASPTVGSSAAKVVSGQRTLREILSQNGSLIASSGVALMFCFIIGSLFWPFLFGEKGGTTLLRELSNFEVARGLITFLVAVTTVGIALILTVYVVVTTDTDAEKHFALAKEVLTGLIGVLGTIVGFYFGSGTTQSPGQSPPAATVAVKELRAEPAEVKPGGAFKVFASSTGTRGQFDYIISFKPENVIPNKSGTSDKPDFSADISVPAAAPLGTLEFSLQLNDKKSGTPLDLTGANKAAVRIAQ